MSGGDCGIDVGLAGAVVAGDPDVVGGAVPEDLLPAAADLPAVDELGQTRASIVVGSLLAIVVMALPSVACWMVV